MRTTLTLGWSCVLGLAACSDQIPPPVSNLTITPDHAGVDQREFVIIRGEHLVAFFGDHAENLTNVEAARLSIGGYDFIDPRPISRNEIQAHVPAFPDPGVLDLSVVDHYGRETILPGAFQILDATCNDYNHYDGTDCTACGAASGCGCDDQGTCVPICGDGKIISPELCDDHNLLVRDGCNIRCEIEDGFSCDGEPSLCRAFCGDAKKLGAETCDDGNIRSGDGCSADCAEERGWSCTQVPGAKSTCAIVCGDGVLGPSETCDDANLIDGDGCDRACALEPRWSCGGEPSVCTGICGDGFILGLEICDDGNLEDFDGCTALCAVELGWSCELAGAPCEAICGDGLLRALEACDDRNTAGGDGCNDRCTAVEDHWSCPTAGEPCIGLCGDALLYGRESCDDANATAGDGCSASCGVEVGWRCSTLGEPCEPIYGDAHLRGAEACDDGNILAGDGCSPFGLIEPGYECLIPGQPCLTVCGDGLHAGQEVCDDGDLLRGNGCSDVCALESGWTCPLQGACTPICGDARVIAANEDCDDGNLFDGDGCNSSCTIDPGFECPVAGWACNPVCGDGLILSEENCDDGNLLAGDGCSNYCFVEVAYSCSGEPSICTTAGCTPHAVFASLNNSGQQANHEQSQFSIDLSFDGNIVAFASRATNIDPRDINDRWDVYARDINAGTTELISVSTAGVLGNADSGNYGTMAIGTLQQEVTVSGDGRYVAFVSRASNLVDGDTNGVADAFVRDRQLGTTVRVSLTSTGAQAIGDAQGLGVDNVVLSSNGRYVAFSTHAINMMPGDTNNAVDVYIHDRSNGQLERASVGSMGQQGNGSLWVGQLSLDGRFVTLDGIAPGLSNAANGGVFLRDRALGTTELISRASGAAGAPAGTACCADVSADGRYVAFQSASALVADDTNNTSDVYLRDRVTQTTTRLSVDDAGQQGTSTNPTGPFSRNTSMSADGRYVAMHSPNGFDAIDHNLTLSDIYVRDVFLNVIYLISWSPTTGLAANGGSVRPRISNNGWYVIFESNADDIIIPDNNVADIFRPLNCEP